MLSLFLLKISQKGICLSPGWIKERIEVSSGLDVVMAAGELGGGEGAGNWAAREGSQGR